MKSFSRILEQDQEVSLSCPSYYSTPVRSPRDDVLIHSAVTTENELEDTYMREIMYNNFTNTVEHSPLTYDIPSPNINDSTRPHTPVEEYSKFPPPENQFCDNASSPVCIPESPFQEELQVSLNMANHQFSPIPTSSIPTTHPGTPIQAQVCIVCENPCSNAHTCPGCDKSIHAIFGPSAEGNEGYGCPVWCITCWLDHRDDNVQKGRVAAKRGQNRQIEKMIKHSNKKIKLSEVGENVLVPIPLVDKRSPFDPLNVPGVVLERSEDGMYKIGTAAGVLDNLYISSQFQSSQTDFLAPEDIPNRSVTLREAILKSSFGKHKLICNCTGGCNSNRCKCKKLNRSCNSKCHKPRSCHNRTTE